MGAHSTYSPPVVLLLNSSRAFFFSWLLLHPFYTATSHTSSSSTPSASSSPSLFSFLSSQHGILGPLPYDIHQGWQSHCGMEVPLTCMESLITGVACHCCSNPVLRCCLVFSPACGVVSIACKPHRRRISKQMLSISRHSLLLHQNKVHTAASVSSTTPLEHIQFHFTKENLYMHVV